MKLLNCVILALSLSLISCSSAKNVVDKLPSAEEINKVRNGVVLAYTLAEQTVSLAETERNRLVELGFLKDDLAEKSAKCLDSVKKGLEKIGPWVKTGKGEAPAKEEIRKYIKDAEDLIEILNSIPEFKGVPGADRAIAMAKALVG